MKWPGSSGNRSRNLQLKHALQQALDRSLAAQRDGEALLGARQWSLLNSYGRLMAGPHAGSYFNAIPFELQRDLLKRLARGEEIEVHLMHRHRSGHYESSSLRLKNGELWLVFNAHEEKALPRVF